MAAKKKSAAKKAAAKKKVAKKTAKSSKPRPAVKKAPKMAAKAAAKRPAAKKAAPVRKPPPAARKAATPAPVMDPAAVMAIDERIALVRANLRELVEQAASSAGAANEELLSQRISEQEARLRDLRKQREELTGSPA